MDFKERFKGRTTVMDKQGMLGILKGVSGEPINKSAIKPEARMALKSKEYQQPPNEVPDYPPQQLPKFSTMNIATRNASSTRKMPTMVQNSYYSAQNNGGDRSPKISGSDPSYNLQQQAFEYEVSSPVHRGMKTNGNQKATMSSGGGYFLPSMGSRDNNQLQESTSNYMDFNSGQSLRRNDSLFRKTPDSYPARGPSGDFAGMQQAPQSQGRNVLLHNSSNILRNIDARYDYENTGGTNHGAMSPSYGMRSQAGLGKSYISHLSNEGNDGYSQQSQAQLAQSHHWGNGSPQVMRPMNAPESFKSFEPLTPMNKPQLHHGARLTNAHSSSEIPKAPQRMKTKA